MALPSFSGVEGQKEEKLRARRDLAIRREQPAWVVSNILLKLEMEYSDG